MTLKFDQEQAMTLISELTKRGKFEYSPKELIEIANTLSLDVRQVLKTMKKMPNVSRGLYDFSGLINSPTSINIQNIKSSSNVVKMKPRPELIKEKDTTQKAESIKEIATKMPQIESYVPSIDPYYVPWGHHSDIEKIVRSKIFFPVFITGLSGNGKTFMVEQACAKADREYIRIQISPETDEDDLLGGFRLVNGETVFSKGPVIQAMETGSVLLIDEIDRGSNKLMCLQSVLEGKPVLIKKTGELISPARGFNVIATANTKGQGSEDGRFVAASIIDEAFLERFTITIEQSFPTIVIEKNILIRHMEKYNCEDKGFAEVLTNWAETIRKTFEDEGINEVISTRRLCHIVQTYSIFKNKKKSIELCINRFDLDTKEAFIDLYDKMSENVANQPQAVTLDNVIDNVI